jgi:hypothetical protein
MREENIPTQTQQNFLLQLHTIATCTRGATIFNVTTRRHHQLPPAASWQTSSSASRLPVSCFLVREEEEGEEEESLGSMRKKEL